MSEVQNGGSALGQWLSHWEFDENLIAEASLHLMSLVKVWKVQSRNPEKLVLVQIECSQELQLVFEEMPPGRNA